MKKMSERTRKQNALRLFEALIAEVQSIAPAAIFDWPELGDLVDASDRALQIAASRYVDGEISRDELIAAAEQLRSSWRTAAHAFGHGSERAA